MRDGRGVHPIHAPLFVLILYRCLSYGWKGSRRRRRVRINHQVVLDGVMGYFRVVLHPRLQQDVGPVAADRLGTPAGLPWRSHRLTPGPCAGWPVPDLLMTILSLVAQISPDKNVNCPCTTAAFTLPPEPMGFVMWCSLTRGLSLVCGFCPSARTFAVRLPSDGRSPFRPCHGLVLVLLCFWFSYRGLAPHKFTPVPGVHLSFESRAAQTRGSTRR